MPLRGQRVDHTGQAPIMVGWLSTTQHRASAPAVAGAGAASKVCRVYGYPTAHPRESADQGPWPRAVSVVCALLAADRGESEPSPVLGVEAAQTVVAVGQVTLGILVAR